MKFLASLWKFLSVPVLMLAVWLCWWGWKHWPAASALSRPIAASELERHKDGVFFVRDTFSFDITNPGLRQENNYGFKGPALAVFPVSPLTKSDSAIDSVSDSAIASPTANRKPPPARFAVISDEARFVGPTIGSFLRSDSMSVVDIKASSSTSKHAGNVGPEMQALVQITADQLGHAPLALPRSGHVFIEGIAHLRTAEEFADLANPAPEVWEIRTGEVAGIGNVVFAFVGAVLLTIIFFVLNLVVKNFDRAELEREMAELENETPLV